MLCSFKASETLPLSTKGRKGTDAQSAICASYCSSKYSKGIETSNQVFQCEFDTNLKVQNIHGILGFRILKRTVQPYPE